MASTNLHSIQSLSLRCVHSHHAPPHSPKSVPLPRTTATAVPGRRQWLFMLTAATTTLKSVELSPSRAEDIPLFGLRKKLKKVGEAVEEAAEEVIKEGIETAEKGIETAERGVEAAEKEIETAVSFGGLAQAGAVAGAEFVGILVATSVVNGILGPEAQKS